jgi:hypothetical protein
MNLLLDLILYAVIGCSEWYLALRRTLACARGEKSLLVGIVFIENILGLWVLSCFVRNNDWWVAISYSAGGAMGALLVNCTNPKPEAAPGSETDAVPNKPEPELPAPALADAAMSAQ